MTAFTLLLAAFCVARAESVQQAAREILEQSGIQGGLIVHVGCGDGTLTVALRAADNFVVQGLEVDPAKAAQARAHIRSKGIYGPVSVARWDGRTLPYADNLVNLVVVSGVGVQVSVDELARILAPGGALLVQQGFGIPETRNLKPPPSRQDGPSSPNAGRTRSTNDRITCTGPTTTRWPKIRL